MEDEQRIVDLEVGLATLAKAVGLLESNPAAAKALVASVEQRLLARMRAKLGEADRSK